MDINNYYINDCEKPLDKIVDDGGFTAIFRTIACVGDSLSSGEFETRDPDGTPHYYDIYKHSWGQYIARMTGAVVYNFSRGGMTAKEYLEGFAESRDFWNKKYASDAYILALGVNDVINKNRPFGNVDDIDLENCENNKYTFVGNYAKIIQKYKEISPDAKFFLMTAPKYPEHSNTDRCEFSETIRKIADLFSNTYVIDLYNYAPVYDEKFKECFYLNGHMNPQGYLLTAKITASYIDYIIRKNHKDFSLVGLNSELKD